MKTNWSVPPVAHQSLGRGDESPSPALGEGDSKPQFTTSVTLTVWVVPPPVPVIVRV
jgi:hypothetical protein